MKLWVTEIRAIDPVDGEMKTWCGPHVPGISMKDAERYCRNNIGYCKVLGELIGEGKSYEEAHSNALNYDRIHQN